MKQLRPYVPHHHTCTSLLSLLTPLSSIHASISPLSPSPPPPFPPKTPCAFPCVDVVEVATLESALYERNASSIRLAHGTYALTSTLMISRDVTIEAADGHTVALDGQNEVQVMTVRNANVRLVGLHINKGRSVRTLCTPPRQVFTLML